MVTRLRDAVRSVTHDRCRNHIDSVVVEAVRRSQELCGLVFYPWLISDR